MRVRTSRSVTVTSRWLTIRTGVGFSEGRDVRGRRRHRARRGGARALRLVASRRRSQTTVTDAEGADRYRCARCDRLKVGASWKTARRDRDRSSPMRGRPPSDDHRPRCCVGPATRARARPSRRCRRRARTSAAPSAWIRWRQEHSWCPCHNSKLERRRAQLVPEHRPGQARARSACPSRSRTAGCG